MFVVVPLLIIIDMICIIIIIMMQELSIKEMTVLYSCHW